MNTPSAYAMELKDKMTDLIDSIETENWKVAQSVVDECYSILAYVAESISQKEEVEDEDDVLERGYF